MPRNAADRTVATVDPDQKDPAKAVERLEAKPSDSDERLSPSNDDGMSDAERRNFDRLERDKAMKARVVRLQRGFSRQFDQLKADFEAERQRERRNFQQQIDALKADRSGGTSADDAAHEQYMKSLESQLEAASEAGDSKKVTELTRKIAKAESDHAQAKVEAMIGKSARRDPAEIREERDPDQQQQPRRPTPQGKAFVRANQDWWDDPEFAAERGAANRIHEVMVLEEESDPGTEEHYAELARRLKAKFPKLEIGGVKLKQRDDDDDDESEDDDVDPRPVQREARRAPIQNFRDRGSAKDQRRRTGVQLTDADFETMRAIGFNPENDKHITQFAKAKRETAEAEAARR